jgi:hypothetical protein
MELVTSHFVVSKVLASIVCKYSDTAAASTKSTNP